MSDESKLKPLYQTEKEIDELKKEIEDKLKTFSKLDLKNFNKDKDAYKQGLNETISELQDYSNKSQDLVNRVNTLKKEDEDASLKEKDFKKRQSSEQKKLKDLQSKIDKLSKKLNQDLEKQKKAEEKEEAKKAKQEAKSAKKSKDSDKTVGNALREIITEAIESEKQVKSENKEEEDKEEEDEDNDDDEESEKEEDTNEKKPGANNQSLKEMIAQAKKANNEEEEEDDENDEDDDEEYESEKEDREKKKKVAQNLLDIFKNKKKQDEVIENKKISASDNEEKNQNVKDDTKEDKSGHVETKFQIKKEEFKKEVKKSKVDEHSEEEEEEEEKEDMDKEEEKSEEEEEEEGEEEEIKEQDREVIGDKPKAPIESEYEIGTKFLVVKDYEPEIEDDLKIETGEIVEFEDLTEDPDYYIVKNSEGNSGSVPSENLKLLSDQTEEELHIVQEEEDKDDSTDHKSKKSKKKSKDLINTNALIVSESVPCTFSDSFLAKVAKDSDHSYETILKPKTSQSHLNFYNFFWDQKENKIRNRMNTILKTIIVHKCVNIPAPNKQELEVLSRTLRVCLFDGVSVIGNVHLIRAHIVGKDDRTWLFEDSYKALVSLFDFSEFFLIANAVPEKPNLGLLFELSIYAKKINTNEETELCCGWAHLPFTDEDKHFQLVNKSYDLVLNGGSVYDKNMPLDPNVPRNNGAFNEFITKMFKESKIKFNIREPTSYALETISVLPSPLICSSLTASFMRFYYTEFAGYFIVPLIDFGSFDVSTEPVHSEFLKTFPLALENADILNAIRIEFNHVKNNLKKDDRNDGTKLRKWFLKIYNEFYPLLFHYTMPALAFHNHDAMEQRQIIINMMAKKIRNENNLEFLLDENQKFDPFNIEELRYEVMA